MCSESSCETSDLLERRQVKNLYLTGPELTASIGRKPMNFLQYLFTLWGSGAISLHCKASDLLISCKASRFCAVTTARSRPRGGCAANL